MPGQGRCEVCGEPLGATPFIVTQMPNGEHLTCRDWTSHPFPKHFDATLRRLRRIRRNLKAALDLVDESGRWLAAAKKRWPVGAAATFAEVTQRRGRIREALSKLTWPASG